MHLVRTDPARNMRRFYSIHLMETTVGTVDVIREWGRLGSPGTVRAIECNSMAQACVIRDRLIKTKQQRGYELRRS